MCPRSPSFLPPSWHIFIHPAEELPHGTAWRPVEAFRKAAVDSGKCVDVPMRLTKYQLRKEAELQVRFGQIAQVVAAS